MMIIHQASVKVHKADIIFFACCILLKNIQQTHVLPQPQSMEKHIMRHDLHVQRKYKNNMHHKSTKY